MRSLRRHHKERMEQRAKFIATKIHFNSTGYNHLKHRGDNISVCSCVMCGNPRKWFKEKTIQEKKAIEAERIE